MSLNAGNAACTTGLSKRIYDNWTADTSNNGFTSPLSGASQAAVQSAAYQLALAIVAEVEADFVFADCYTTAAQSIPAATMTVINFSTVVTDSDSAVTTGAAWHFTVPAAKPGTYLITTAVSLNNGSNGTLFLSVLKNGSEYKRGVRYQMSTAPNEVQLTAAVKLAGGDTIAIGMYQGSAGAQTLEGGSSLNSWLTISKLVGS